MAIANSAAVKAGVHVSFQIRLLSRYMPRSGTAGSDHMVTLFLVFKGSSVLFFMVAVQFQGRRVPFLHTLSSIYYLYTF